MKKLLFSALLISLLFVSENFCQFDSGYPKFVRGNWGAEVLVEGTLNATTYDTLTTDWIDISDFDASNEYIQFYVNTNSGGALATDTAWIYINAVGNEAASTTGQAELGQVVDTTNSETPFYTASTISNKRPRYIKFVIAAASTVSGGNVDDSVDVSAVIKLPLKDSGVDGE